MPNEGPYGGRLVVRHAAGEPITVLWEARARGFVGDKESLGTLEYAVRIVDSDHETAVSRDLKCVVRILNAPTSESVTARVLIVSGYDLPPESATKPSKRQLLGQSYFITAASYDMNDPNSASDSGFPFSYDVELHYDDDDLYRLGLTKEPSPSKLSLCYIQWTKTTIMSPINPVGVPPGKINTKEVRREFVRLEAAIQSAVDSKDFEAAAQRRKEMRDLRASTGWTMFSYWEQRWRRVKESDETSAPGNQPTNSGAVLTEPIVVTAKRIIQTPGSRLIRAKSVSEPAHLGIMYHAN